MEVEEGAPFWPEITVKTTGACAALEEIHQL
jgi:hypothetical protein